MPQTINTNIASLNAQRNLNKSQNALGTSLQRLSSGMRINSAKDDAAGLAISERFTAQIRGLNQAVRNSNDGISLAQTAEGSLGEVTNNLQRVRELAVQSANATNSSSDRVAMQKEVNELVNEIDRVANQTNFNGVKLLDGSFTAQAFQVGANVGETISISSIVNATKGGLGLDNSTATSTAGTTVAGPLVGGTLTINGNDVAAVATRDAFAIAAAITASSTNVVATAADSSVNSGAFTSSGGSGTGSKFAVTLSADGEADFIIESAGSAGTDVTAGEMNTALGGASAALLAAGYTVTGDFTAGATFARADGKTITITGADTAGDSTGAIANEGTSGYGSIASIVSTTEDLVIAGATGATAAGLTVETKAASANTLDVSTVQGANDLITAVDAALNTVNGSRATLGAVQNRFESVVTSLQTSSESLSAARSRIQDTDFASETANLTKVQILQQAGTAMLSQANQLPQNVLSLLR